MIVTSLLLCACEKQDHEDLSEPNQLIIKITEDSNPLKGTQLSYSQETFLIEAEPSLEFSPDQGPISVSYTHLTLPTKA